MRSTSWLLVTALAACTSRTAVDTDPDGKEDVFGTDSRRERYQITSAPLRAVATSSAALVPSWNFARDAATATWSAIEPDTLKDAEGLCKGQRFSTQPKVGYCSATLIDDDIILTAGHCVLTEVRCADVRVVFDFAYTSAPGTNVMRVAENIPDRNVYRCKQVLAAEDVWADHPRDWTDYAVVRLDRPVEGRAPVHVDWDGRRDAGTPLYTIGHPAGIPQKLATGALLETSNTMLETDVDSFGGNSGGGVFDRDGSLLGQMVFATTSGYVLDEERGCKVESVCGDNTDCEYNNGAYRVTAVAAKLTASVRRELGVP